MSKILVDDRGSFDKSVCDYHRIHLPYLRGEKFDARSDLYIFNGFPTHGKQGLKNIKSKGFKVVMDLDDSLEIPKHHMLAPVFDSGLREDLIWCLSNSDVIITTTEALAKEFKQYNKNVFIVPNGLPFDEEGFTLTTDRVSKTPFVWAGSETHKHDLKLLPDLADRLTLCGQKTDIVEWLSKREWDTITRRILPNSKYEMHRSLDTYMSAYDGHSVALAPLEDNEFNRAKSNLKVLEAGAKGLPIICSDLDCYQDEGLSQYVLYAKDKTDWENLTEMLYLKPDVAKEIGMGLAEYVRANYNITKMNDIRREIFRNL